MSKELNIVYEDDMSIGYIKIAEGQVVQTIEISEDLNLDLDSRGKVLGLELLSLPAKLPEERLITEFNLDADLIHRISHGFAA
jgi:uncharacterized protein YuzE